MIEQAPQLTAAERAFAEQHCPQLLREHDALSKAIENLKSELDGTKEMAEQRMESPE